MSNFYSSYNIQSIKNNPFLGLILNKEYTTEPITKNTTTYNTFSNISTNIGNFIINIVIGNYNLQYGTSFNAVDFGIVLIPNDQNSKCSYLIFPLKTDIPLLIRTYVQIGDKVKLDFQHLGFLDTPNYEF